MPARQPFTVMSFNLRCPLPENTPGGQPGHPDYWVERLPAIVEVLREHRPTIVGTQEGVTDQLDQIVAALPHYEVIGEGREIGGVGEHSAILVDTGRVEVRECTQFWLSETPDEPGSRSWGSSCTRVAVVADLLLDGSTHLTAANTHLDHISAEARLRGVETLLTRLPDEGRAIIVTGDFNCEAGVAEPWQALSAAGLSDTWLDEQRAGDRDGVDTFHGYAEPTKAGATAERIDWIMASSDLSIIDAAIVTDRAQGVWPSDHWPVAATLSL